MFDIEIYCDRNITERDFEMIRSAAKLTERVFGCGFTVFRDRGWSAETDKDIPGSCDEILDTVQSDGKGRKNASRILDLMVEVMKAREKKGAMIIFTGYDLSLKDTWCFGAARIGGMVSVQSICRYRDLSEEEKQAVITRTLRHEVGHIHKCASDPKRANTEKKYGMHCTTKGCTMRQSPTLKDLLRHAKEEDPGNCLCKLCRDDLERFKTDHYY